MSRKAGVVSEETKTRLLQAAAEEFYSYGYNGSSLRRICQNAQLTTGALYFFFENKDDLFNAVISMVAEPIKKMMMDHFASEREQLDPSRFPKGMDMKEFIYLIDDEEDDLEVFRSIIHLYFQNKIFFDIVLQNQTHPSVMKFMDEIIQLAEEQIAKLFELIYFFYPEKEAVDPFAVHWLAHLQIESVLAMFSHDFTEEEAIEHSQVVLRILFGGFIHLL